MNGEFADQTGGSLPSIPDALALRERLNAYSLDDPAAVKPFSRCLAEREGWTREATLAAIAEYKRFVFIALTAGPAATPSKAVDAVWHLHLQYTREYWGPFCGDVLRQPFHHHPGTGAEGEDEHYATLYRQTLENYRRIFNEEPPIDLWPRNDSAEKETAPTQPPRLGPRRSKHWVASALMLLGSSAYAADLDFFDYSGPDFLQFFTALWACVVVVICAVYLVEYGLRRRGAARDTQPGRGTALHEVAFLRGGVHRMAQVATLEMVAAQLIDIKVLDDGAATVRPNNEAETESFKPEHAFLFFRSGTQYVDLHRKFLQRGQRVENAMHAQGWWWRPKEMHVAPYAIWVLCTLALVIAFIKAVVGIERHKPIFLLAVCAIGVIGMGALLLRMLPGLRSSGITLEGRSMLRKLATPASESRSVLEALIWSVAMHGPRALSGTVWAAYQDPLVLAAKQTAVLSQGGTGSGSPYCTSSCSSSDGGGGGSCSSGGNSSCGGCSSS